MIDYILSRWTFPSFNYWLSIFPAGIILGSIAGWFTGHLKEKFNLIEQNKSLKCLYGITQIFENSAIPEDRLFQTVADMLPPAFHFNDIAAARIILDKKTFKAGDFQDSEHKISEDVLVFFKEY